MGNVTITTGPSAGSVLEGQCGRCDGLANVDSLGVYEFDTATDKIVGNHVMPDGTGGDPFGSPDGRHVVLVGRNGGQVIRILKAGVNGAISTVAIDLELGFSTVDEETSVVYNDFAFIQTAVDDDIMNTGIARDLIVIASGTENKVAFIDITDDKNDVTIVTLSNSAVMTAKKNRRQVEWCVGTPYVWVDGASADEMYILNIDTKQMVTTIQGINSKKMISVENYAAKRTADLIAQQMMAAVTDTDQVDINSVNPAPVVVQNKDDSDIDPVGIAALVIGVCALVVGVANMVYMSRSKSSSEGGTDESVDQKTLGSKNLA